MKNENEIDRELKRLEVEYHEELENPESEQVHYLRGTMSSLLWVLEKEEIR